MKTYLEPSRPRRANIWLDEAPPADFAASSYVRRVVTPRVVLPATRRIAAVELNINHGPRASYGLIGGELSGAAVDGLEVVVSVSSCGFAFQPNLALQPEEARTGLPAEYAEAVIVGVSKAAETRGAPSNAALRFRWAAHGLVGSSASIFERISEIVVRLLTLTPDASEEHMVALLRT